MVSLLQEFAVRTFRKKRGPNDFNKLTEFRHAVKDLETAMKFFDHLLTKEKDITQLDHKRLEQHVNFCTDQV